MVNFHLLNTKHMVFCVLNAIFIFLCNCTTPQNFDCNFSHVVNIKSILLLKLAISLSTFTLTSQFVTEVY